MVATSVLRLLLLTLRLQMIQHGGGTASPAVNRGGIRAIIIGAVLRIARAISNGTRGAGPGRDLEVVSFLPVALAASVAAPAHNAAIIEDSAGVVAPKARADLAKTGALEMMAESVSSFPNILPSDSSGYRK